MKLLLALCILLSGCASSGFQGKDEFKVFNFEQGIKNLRLTVAYMTDEELQKQCSPFAHVGSAKYLGCAMATPGDYRTCKVYLVKPTSFNDQDFLKILGHEILHCLSGQHE